jgi:hypothetical protein
MSNQASHVLYKGVVTSEPQKGQIQEIRATKEHSGCFVFAVRYAVLPSMQCIGYFEDSNQAIEEAVGLANDQRQMLAMGQRKAVTA